MNKSNPCSCICCKKELTSKGIHTHYLIAHTNYGNDHKLRAKSFAPQISTKLIRNTEIKHNNLIIKYNLSPKICLNCSNPLSYNKKHNKFCSNSCSASFNNSNRIRLAGTNEKISKSILTTIKAQGLWGALITGNRYKNKTICGQFSRVSFCLVCNSTIKNKYVKSCSNICYRKLLSIIHSKSTKRKLKKFTVQYKNMLLDSSYELAVAVSLDENNIKWVRPEPLPYHRNNILKHYFPDFYLIDYNVYLDPKNDYLIKTQCDKIRIAEIENKCRILILNSTQLDWIEIQKLI